jgi:uncharacterized protein (DUF1778 family)
MTTNEFNFGPLEARLEIRVSKKMKADINKAAKLWNQSPADYVRGVIAASTTAVLKRKRK